jgi:hypothetical protein
VRIVSPGNPSVLAKRLSYIRTLKNSTRARPRLNAAQRNQFNSLVPQAVLLDPWLYELLILLTFLSEFFYTPLPSIYDMFDRIRRENSRIVFTCMMAHSFEGRRHDGASGLRV